ncbi:MAG: protein-tyrosine phosphatase family protein [Candidatus Promineifilaceae bacterium]
MERPNKNTYWVIPGQLLAGEYPGAKDGADALERVGRYLDVGVTHFFDLTQPHELRPYESLLEVEAARRGVVVSYRRLPITDVSVPRAPEEMVEILDAIDGSLAGGGTAYVHCWGGVGRTGTVVGCYLVRHGMTGDEALAQIGTWWQGVDKSWRHPRSPETVEQADYVRSWPAGK